MRGRFAIRYARFAGKNCCNDRETGHPRHESHTAQRLNGRQERRSTQELLCDRGTKKMHWTIANRSRVARQTSLTRHTNKMFYASWMIKLTRGYIALLSGEAYRSPGSLFEVLKGEIAPGMMLSARAHISALSCARSCDSVDASRRVADNQSRCNAMLLVSRFASENGTRIGKSNDSEARERHLCAG
ncbi:hypothetical protein AWB78_07755 [Caballeronia calidae]|uniref:Uncharacterized protein n=1 Tax=Caballeronia calidae TaxID=1777139 RepID=A0A158EG69_9BURK|nr:hypothetical protein AWB78_07755 [Caballeronia calidae]